MSEEHNPEDDTFTVEDDELTGDHPGKPEDPCDGDDGAAVPTDDE